jgi:hypothetical protein
MKSKVIEIKPLGELVCCRGLFYAKRREARLELECSLCGSQWLVDDDADGRKAMRLGQPGSAANHHHTNGHTALKIAMPMNDSRKA